MLVKRFFRISPCQWVLLFILCVLALISGCAGKQQSPDANTVEAPPFINPSEISAVSDATLSRNEIAALESTGQIDKNVPDHAKGDVAMQYKYFLRDGRKIMCSFSRQSEQYLAYAREVFRTRGMPEELANLAIIESGYRPKAVSRAGAAGAWQFMPFTGKKYGLAQDWWQDERLDPYRATEAAADYLQKLYNDFGDWPTAIAAYNAGEGKMSRAKESAGARDFFEVKAKNHLLDYKTQLRAETTQYVPRFMAVTKIMRNLPELGFDPIAPEKAVEVARLEARPGTDLTAVSRACNLSWSEFQKYNPHHKRTITCTDKVTYIYVPRHAHENARNFLCTNEAANYAGWKPVRIASSRDSLEKISKRSNIPLGRLQIANPGINRLKTGQTILLPGSLNLHKTAYAALESKGKAKAAPVKPVQATGGREHQLKSNETLYALSRKYNVSIDDIARHNGIEKNGKLHAGQTLRIPQKSAPAKGGASGKIGKTKKKTHIVGKNQSLWTIAKRYNVSVDDLKRWNNVNEKNLRFGATLVVEN